jgi:hypothetical protein
MSDDDELVLCAPTHIPMILRDHSAGDVYGWDDYTTLSARTDSVFGWEPPLDGAAAEMQVPQHNGCLAAQQALQEQLQGVLSKQESWTTPSNYVCAEGGGVGYLEEQQPLDDGSQVLCGTVRIKHCRIARFSTSPADRRCRLAALM